MCAAGLSAAPDELPLGESPQQGRGSAGLEVAWQ